MAVIDNRRIGRTCLYCTTACRGLFWGRETDDKVPFLRLCYKNVYNIIFLDNNFDTGLLDYIINVN